MANQFEVVIGLEVHAQLNTRTKIFCGCRTTFGMLPNTNVCPVCLGLPGALPVLNVRVVDYTIRLGLALGCKLNKISHFARKNYFYPDLPKGYQISQYDYPACSGGHVPLMLDGERQSVELTRIHIEEDAGKLIHYDGRGESGVDLNRAGVPLLEIVSEPVIRSSKEASAYLKSLHAIVCYLDICDGNMEQGSFRCDANVSVRPIGQTTLGVKAELKNLNSFRNVQRAIDYEFERQINVIQGGCEVVQETRLWDADANVSRSMRSKEQAHDYRYFPDPDLMPLRLLDSQIEQIRGQMPELPLDRLERFQLQYALSTYDAEVLTATRPLADFFERVAGSHADAKRAANWITTELMSVWNERQSGPDRSPIEADALAELLNLIGDGTISGKMGKDVFRKMLATGDGAKTIVAQSGGQVSNKDALTPIIDQILDANIAQVQAYLGGKTKLLGFFVGQVMKQTRGKANPQVVNELLVERIGLRRDD